WGSERRTNKYAARTSPSAARGAAASTYRGRGRSRGLQRVFHVREGLELLRPQVPVDLLDLAHVDVGDDVAGRGVARDRAARAFERHALHRRDQLVAVGVAAGLLQRLGEQTQALTGAERGEV